MKKIVSLVTGITLLILSASWICSYAQAASEDEVINNIKLEEATSLLKAISDNSIYDEPGDEFVERWEYVSAVVEITGGNHGETGSVFTDVPSNAEYASDIYCALDTGLISSGDTFRPDDPIKLQEALKVAISALNLDIYADRKGGYPSGYNVIAEEVDLTDNIKSTEYLTHSDMIILIYNLLNANPLTITSIQGLGAQYGISDETLLQSLYNIERAEGIITQTKTVSYDPLYTYNKNNFIVMVDGEPYESEIDLEEYFGMNCMVFYRHDDSSDTIISVYPKKNNEVSLDIDDIDSFDGTRLVYYADGGSKRTTYKVSNSYLELYNGRISSPRVEDITQLSGTVRLLDNNDDGTYEVLFINCYSYVAVKNVNIPERMIEDQNSSENNISIDEDTVLFTVCSYDNSELKISDIKAGDVLEIQKSNDNSLLRIRILDAPITVTIDSISDDEITADGVEYSISGYAKEYCANRFTAGTQANIYVGRNNEIAYAYFAESDYRYGYMTNLYVEDDGSYAAKIFTMSGAFEHFSLANRIKMDNMSRMSPETVYNNIGADPQLIRYKLNGDGEISAIDTAEDIIVDDSLSIDSFEMELDEGNKLRRYDFQKSSYRLMNNYCIETNFNVANATVILVPVEEGNSNRVDTGNTEEFQIVDISSIRAGFSYAYFDVYDIDEYGTASIIVARNVKTLESPYSFISGMKLKSSAAMVSKVSEAVNDENEFGLLIELLTASGYEEYFMSEDVACLMPEGERLAKGDIVRYVVDGNEIKDITLDFDCSRFDVNYSYDPESARLNQGYTTLTYQAGKLYTMNDTYCYYSNEKIDTNEYDFSPVNLMNSYIAGQSVLCCDLSTGEIKTIGLNELRPYKNYGNDGDYILIKQDGLLTQNIFVYRGYYE